MHTKMHGQHLGTGGQEEEGGGGGGGVTESVNHRMTRVKTACLSDYRQHGSLTVRSHDLPQSSVRLGTWGSHWVGWVWGCRLGARQWASSLAAPC